MINEIFYILFFILSLQNHVCDAYSTSQSRRATFQVLHSRRWLVVPCWTARLKKLEKKSEAYGDAGDAPGEVGIGGGPGVAFPQWLHHLQVLGLS